jgi:hypothetical protein
VELQRKKIIAVRNGGICKLMQLLFRSIQPMRLFPAQFIVKSRAFGDNKNENRRSLLRRTVSQLEAGIDLKFAVCLTFYLKHVTCNSYYIKRAHFLVDLLILLLNHQQQSKCCLDVDVIRGFHAVLVNVAPSHLSLRRRRRCWRKHFA